MKSKQKIFFLIGVILFIIILIEYIIDEKIWRSVPGHNPTSWAIYIKNYELNNIYRVPNIYLVKIINIILGAFSCYLLIISKEIFRIKFLVWVLIAASFIIGFMSLFSLM